VNLRKDHYRFATEASAEGETIQSQAAQRTWHLGLPAAGRQVGPRTSGYPGRSCSPDCPSVGAVRCCRDESRERR
jgi:hypothetical protein